MDREILLKKIMDPNETVTITICSPLRNAYLIERYKAYYTALGNLVLTPINYGSITPIDKEKDIENIHKIHDKKILMSDAILVINHNKYIGKDTTREILYAIENKIRVMYTEIDEDVDSICIYNGNIKYPIYL